MVVGYGGQDARLLEAHFLDELEIGNFGAKAEYKGLTFVKPIIEIPQKEVELFLKLKKIKYKNSEEKNAFEKDVDVFLSNIGKRRKAVSFSIVKSIEKMK